MILWLGNVRTVGAAGEEGGSRSVGPRRILDPRGGERGREGVSHPRPPQAQARDLPTAGGTSAHFLNYCSRHWSGRLSPAHLLRPAQRQALGPHKPQPVPAPPPGAEPGSRLVLVRSDPRPPPPPSLPRWHQSQRPPPLRLEPEKEAEAAAAARGGGVPSD